VVLFIDDLQWGDLDSAGFLVNLLYRLNSPALLLLGTYRRDEVDSSPFLQALLYPSSPAAPADLRDIALDALSDSAARALVREIEGDDDASDEHVDALVREARGNPLFLCELARARLEEPAAGVRLETVLRNRIARVPGPAGKLLATVAVAAQPLPINVVARAAQVTDQHSTLVLLLSARLIRSLDTGGQQRVECYHDRIRETLVADLEPKDLRRIHRSLARALEQSPDPDVLALVDHWQGAGVRDKAGRYASLAGDLASRALAFDRATQCYRLALELQEPQGAERCTALRRLGEALTNTGLLADAAESFAEAAALAGADEALELKRRAMESFVRAGRFDDCLIHAKALLADVGLKMPGSGKGALISVALSRLWIKLRGLRYRECSADDVPIETTRKMQVCWSLAGGLAFIDPILGTAFQAKHLRLALAAGESTNVALALAYEVSFRAVAGYSQRDKCEAIGAQTQELATRIGHDYAYATTHVTGGLAAFLTGQWELANERFERGQVRLSEIATGVTWEADIAVLFRMATLLYLGEIRALTQQVPLYLHDADERGNQYLSVGLRSWRSNAAWLALDQPEEAEAQLTQAGELSQLTDDSFQLPHYYRMLGRVQIRLYVGEVDSAWEEVETGYRALQHSLIKRVQMTRVEAAFLRARVALAAASGDERDARLKAAEQMAQSMAKERCPWAEALAVHTRALVAAARGDQEQAASGLAQAAQSFDAVDMKWLAHAARWRLAQITGQQDDADAMEFMRDQEIGDPARFAALYAPLPV